MLIAVYRAIRQEVLDSRVIFADETIHRQLEENGGKWRWFNVGNKGGRACNIGQASTWRGNGKATIGQSFFSGHLVQGFIII
jgi:hypothetical protein